MGLKENMNFLNKSKNNGQEEEMMSRILQEKENYIFKLEGECGDMRREID
jgi:hypothetical protein